ncbi:MAG TPA: hypothetical protein VEB69_14385 [Acidimicrobiia bacterium]|nr:hypothetical protein [Acidimicrobiia bacterium]
MSLILDRLAAKAKPAGILSTIEDPLALARLGTFVPLAAAVDSAAFGILFFIFGEPVAGWVTLGLSTSFAAVWLWNAMGPGSGRMREMVRLVLILAMANHFVGSLVAWRHSNSGAYLGCAVSVILIASLVLTRAEIISWSLFSPWSARSSFGFLEEGLAAGRPPPDPTLPAFSSRSS